MQKDEELLLEPWILHHGYLFGFENIFIFDNGSTSPLTHAVLHRYARLGLNVVWDKSTTHDYTLKGWIVGDQIKELQAQHAYDFYLPMDCDEFIAFAGAGGVSMHRQAIHDCLASHVGVNQVLRIADCLNNVPGRCNIFAIQGHRKSIVPATGLIYLDHGHHVPDIEGGGEYILSDLIHIHMHNKPLSYLQKSARDKLAPFVDVDDHDALRAFNGVGNHLQKYLFYTADGYYRSMNSYPCVRFDGFEEFLAGFRLFDFAADWGRGAPDFAETGPRIVIPAEVEAGLEISPELNLVRPPAIVAFLQWHDLHTAEAEKLRELSHDAIVHRDWERAVTALSEYRVRAPDEPDGFAWSVLALRESGATSEAEELGAAALQRFPSHERLFLEWALICFVLRQWNEAEIRFAEFRRRFPDSREGYVRSIEVARELGDVAAADELTAAVETKF